MKQIGTDNINATMQYIVLSAGHEWNFYCWKGAVEQTNNIRFIKDLLPRLLGRFWRKPFKNKLFIRLFWFPLIKHYLSISHQPTTLIVYDWGILTEYSYCIRKLRRLYPLLKIVYVFTNIIKITGATTFGLLPTLKQDYDEVFAFDPEDAKKYGFKYSRLVYTASLPANAPDTYEYDVFYVGQAKDRYAKLIEIYRRLRADGFRCLFYIFGVPEEKQYRDVGLIYNKRLHYSDVLDYMAKARCLVDVIQGDSAGLTIKTCEAVVLDKKLITTNFNVVNESFYKSNNILLYNSTSDLKKFMESEFVPYSESDKHVFSHEQLIKQIEAK